MQRYIPKVVWRIQSTLLIVFLSNILISFGQNAVQKAKDLNERHLDALAEVNLGDSMLGTLEEDGDESFRSYLKYWFAKSGAYGSVTLESIMDSKLETGLDSVAYPKFTAFRDEVVISMVFKPKVQTLNSYRLRSPESRAKYVLDTGHWSSTLRLVAREVSELDFDGYLLIFSYKHSDATSFIEMTVGELLALLIDGQAVIAFRSGEVTKQEVLRRSKIFINLDRVELGY